MGSSFLFTMRGRGVTAGEKREGEKGKRGKKRKKNAIKRQISISEKNFTPMPDAGENKQFPEALGGERPPG